MTITVLCPNLKCRKVLAVPDHTRGKKVRCKYCTTTFVVPAKRPSRAPAPPPQPSDEEIKTVE